MKSWRLIFIFILLLPFCAAAQEASDTEVDLDMDEYSKGKVTYKKITNKAGFLTYKNNMTGVTSDFNIFVKAKVQYGFGYIDSEWITVPVKKTIGWDLHEFVDGKEVVTDTKQKYLPENGATITYDAEKNVLVVKQGEETHEISLTATSEAGIFTPKTQGFLNHAKRIRVSRELSRTRRGQVMPMRLIFRSPCHGISNDRGVTLPRADGNAR